jgi:phosphatidylserine/phosphatidylglycerophosphate/cardiolipin synthase-like enzyme
MIADGGRGYLGSANISQNGLQKSIEVGVVLQGPPAAELELWFDGLSGFFEEVPVGC